MHSRDMLRKAKGDHPLSEGSRDNQVGEAGPIYQRPRVSKLTQKNSQSLVHSDQMVLGIVRQEAGLCERRLTQGLHSQRTFK
jgi:hypothetical protein